MLLYAPVPLLAWAALRLRPFGTANAIAIVASIAVWSVVKGIGVFPGSSPDQSVESIQLFLLVLSVSFLSIAVLAAEQQKRVEEFRTLLDTVPITILVTDDSEARHIIANRTGYDAMGIPREPTLGNWQATVRMFRSASCEMASTCRRRRCRYSKPHSTACPCSATNRRCCSATGPSAT